VPRGRPDARGVAGPGGGRVGRRPESLSGNEADGLADEAVEDVVEEPADTIVGGLFSRLPRHVASEIS